MTFIVGIAGRMGSGKGSAAEYLVKDYRAEQFVFSDILMDVLERLNVKKDRSNLQRLGVEGALSEDCM